VETKRRTKREGNEHTAVAAIPGGLGLAWAVAPPEPYTAPDAEVIRLL